MVQKALKFLEVGYDHYMFGQKLVLQSNPKVPRLSQNQKGCHGILLLATQEEDTFGPFP